MRAAKTEETSVPPLALHVMALELKYLQINTKLAHRDDTLQLFRPTC